MPIYEYSCKECKQIFEDWQKDYEEREIPCPVCGGSASRLISSTSFVLKGGGWYASGYNAPTASAPASGTTAEGESAPKPVATEATTTAPVKEVAKPCTPCKAATGACSSTST